MDFSFAGPRYRRGSVRGKDWPSVVRAIMVPVSLHLHRPVPPGRSALVRACWPACASGVSSRPVSRPVAQTTHLPDIRPLDAAPPAPIHIGTALRCAGSPPRYHTWAANRLVPPLSHLPLACRPALAPAFNGALGGCPACPCGAPYALQRPSLRPKGLLPPSCVLQTGARSASALPQSCGVSNFIGEYTGLGACVNNYFYIFL